LFKVAAGGKTFDSRQKGLEKEIFKKKKNKKEGYDDDDDEEDDDVVVVDFVLCLCCSHF
jgi:hypothetical protein